VKLNFQKSWLRWRVFQQELLLEWETGLSLLSAAGAKGTTGAAALTIGLATAGSLVGGGMLSGIFVISAPVLIFGVTGYKIVSKANHKKLQHEKEFLLQEILLKHAAIQNLLQDQVQSQAKEIQKLEFVLSLLKRAQNQLEEDLK
jgi:hypothetical protein